MTPRNQKGFTYIELLVVIMILGILAAMIAPVIGRVVGGVGIKSEALKLSQEIRYTQSKAVSEGQNFYFKINRSIGYYKVYALTQDADGNDIEDIRKEGTLDDVVSGISATFPVDPNDENCSVLVYLPTGAPSQAGSITFTSQSGDSVQIIVALGTGRVRVE